MTIDYRYSLVYYSHDNRVINPYKVKLLENMTSSNEIETKMILLIFYLEMI